MRLNTILSVFLLFVLACAPQLTYAQDQPPAQSITDKATDKQAVPGADDKGIDIPGLTGHEEAVPQPSPEQLQGLYHQVWEKVGSMFSDHQALREKWGAWEHRYDGQLNTLEDLDKALAAMVGSLGDRWTRYISVADQKAAQAAEADGIRSLGMMLKHHTDGTYTVEVKQYGSPAYNSDLREGDLVKSIGGKELKGLSETEAAALLKGKDGSKVTVVVTVNGKDESYELTLTATPEATVEARLLPGNIAYVRLPDFMSEEAVGQMVMALAQMHKTTGGDIRGLIFDLRNNPGGQFNLALAVSSLFIEKGVITRSTTRTDRQITETSYSVIPVQPYMVTGEGAADMAALTATLQNVPMVLLVNSSSASASEVTTGALKDNGRAFVIGTTTFGKGVGYVRGKLPNGAILSITSLTYLTPKGFDLNGKGITPDQVVEQPRSSKDDAQLNAALAHLKELMKQKTEQVNDARNLATQPQETAAPSHISAIVIVSAGAGFVLVLTFAVVLVVRRRRSR